VGGWQLPGGYEDWDLWMSLAERGWRGIGIPDVTAHYRAQSGRRLSRSSGRYAERMTRLRARHPNLIALPMIDALPLSPTRKRLLGGAVTHVSYGNGLGTLVARYRAHRLLRAQRVLKDAPWCASPGPR
jgi:hypothetical protein